MSKEKKFYYKKNNDASFGRSAIFIKLTLILVIPMVLVMSLNMLMRYNKLNEQKEALEEQIAEKEERIEELNYFVSSPLTEDYIIRIARERLRLVFPEDKVYFTDVDQ